jgi:Family of unknown function (DUF6188)
VIRRTSARYTERLAVMDLGLRGKSLQSVLVKTTVRMQLADVYFIVIESPFRLDIHGDSFSLSPEEPDAVLQALRQLVGHTIEEATADAAGALHVIFGRRTCPQENSLVAGALLLSKLRMNFSEDP